MERSSTPSVPSARNSGLYLPRVDLPDCLVDVTRFGERSWLQRQYFILLLSEVASQQNGEYEFPFFRNLTPIQADKLSFPAKMTVSVRNRALGQSRAEVFDRWYQANVIEHDVQAILLEKPPQERLHALAASMLVDWDPSAPYELTNAQRQKLGQHRKVKELREKNHQLYRDCIMQYGGVAKAAGTTLGDLHASGKREMARLRQSLRKAQTTKSRDHHFATRHTREVQRQVDLLRMKRSAKQHDGDSSDCDSCSESGADVDPWNPPPPQHVFQERTLVADAFFDANSAKLSPRQALVVRVRVLKNLIRLCSLREPSRRGREPSCETKSGPTGHGETWDERAIPWLCPELCCYFCLCEQNLPLTARRKRFARLDSLQSHAERIHSASASRTCPNPDCKKQSSTYSAFANHSLREHKFNLGTRFMPQPMIEVRI
jgi:hypothetical protein